PAHAVVIGAGMAGLAAAQALSRHVERVTLLDRDDVPDRAPVRATAAAGGHAHALRPGALAAIERLLPGFTADLLAAGAVPIRLPEDMLWLSPAGWMPRFPALDRHVFLSSSRELIECTLRRRVLDAPQVVVRPGLEVRGLRVGDGRVRAVEVRARHAGPGAPSATIDADLVVDASGTCSPAPSWIEAVGHAPPPESTSDAGPAFACRLYRRAAGDTPGWKGALLQAGPGGGEREGALLPVEGGRWLLTLTGAHGDVPPADEVGFLAFAHALRSPDIARVVARAEPLGPVAAYRPPPVRRRWYECQPHAVDGFLAVGGALGAVDPVAGQGLSVAALAAEALDRRLAGHLADRRDLRRFSAGAQRDVARIGDGSWRMATTGHRSSPAPRRTGRTPWARTGRSVRVRYERVVGAAALGDPRVNAALLDVVALLAPPRSLRRPAVAARALGHRSPRPGPPPIWSCDASPNTAGACW
ncbi:MAG TPA: FAD-dependent oxidoreductase, partial [Acidimicrobiales bacterium]|nr:FAD-dependent oxidoreductase [Acidimicrobiales bacterium]